MDTFCKKKKLNCILLNGPIHKSIGEQSSDYISKIKKTIKENSSIEYLDKVFLYPNRYMGDSDDHIDPKYKKIVTKGYFEYLREYLRY